MTEKPIDLDGRRGMAAQKATDARRQRREVEADQAALRARQEELEKFLLASPSTTWPEAAVKAQYIIRLFARTSEASDPRRQELILRTLKDLDHLTERSQEKP